MDPGRALRRWSDTQHNSLCLPHSHCLGSQAQLYSKLGQAATGLHNPQTETALTASKQRLKGKGRSLCFSHVASTSRRDNGRAPQQRFKWRYITRAHSLLLLCSWLNNWILTSHYSCIPWRPELHWKTQTAICFILLLLSGIGKKKKNRCNSIPLQI